MKTFIISRNPHTKPISYKQSKNTAQLRFLGPKPPEFIMRSKVNNKIVLNINSLASKYQFRHF